MLKSRPKPIESKEEARAIGAAMAKEVSKKLTLDINGALSKAERE